MSEQTNNEQTQHTLHPVKKIEIIVRGEKESFVRDLLDDASVSGYTIHHNVTGRGEHGFHEGRLLFNDQSSLIMLLAVASLTPLFEKSSGVMFVSDTSVVRLDKFIPEE